jgi:hypothetical protein
LPRPGGEDQRVRNQLDVFSMEGRTDCLGSGSDNLALGVLNQVPSRRAWNSVVEMRSTAISSGLFEDATGFVEVP